ncbi:MAG: hypothetical protein A2015_02980 [Spirochaetes bacterium GWF1_31_7]|nr:MAG: hypothetical protein A2Y29_01585 [Spirochaetes bacterium GWE2_31_10]OHD49205.1 MAG: hypothetical protein A2015_02980 [Spirochaetes bacterium GWF1_31_7]OHD82008.1 MAG: hypothetical protein A2355_18485 [Spirochaetes bacterium RIFOXYB1_FULL_32_8]HBD95703.1 transcriptional regulator [Spirochaetia bacterium]HBI37035.1 transcriptional regulator [Spirochaetia bacterium]
MLTDLGKFLRKLRIDRNLLLKDMADLLNVSPAYLSSIENGKKEPPFDWVVKISNLYSLDFDQNNELKRCVIDARNLIRIDFKNFDKNNQDIILSFARKLDGLDSDKRNEILNLLK